MIETKDVFEYAAYMGALHAMKKFSLSSSLFDDRFETGKQCRFIYELAYLLEQESGMLLHSTEFEVEGTIYNWEDSIGWGEVKFLHLEKPVIKKVSYHLLDESIWGAIGESVTIKYRVNEHGIEILSIKQ
jgi:hypothetical protein